MFVRGEVGKLEVVNRVLVRKGFVFSRIKRPEDLKIVVFGERSGGDLELRQEGLQIDVGGHIELLKVLFFESGVHIIFLFFLSQNAFELLSYSLSVAIFF